MTPARRSFPTYRGPLDPGGFCLLTGLGNAGKTTLLRIISLAARPSSGRLMLFGSDAARLDRAARSALRRRIGIVFQDVRVVEDWTVADNVALPLRIAGAAQREIARNVPELLAWVGLEKRIDARGFDIVPQRATASRDRSRHHWTARTLDRRRADREPR